MSVSQIIQIFTALPQLIEDLKKMSDEDKEKFVGQLGLQNEEKDTALRILAAFQEGQPISTEEQLKAQKLLEKSLEVSKLDLSTILKLMSESK